MKYFLNELRIYYQLYVLRAMKSLQNNKINIEVTETIKIKKWSNKTITMYKFF